MRLPNKALTFDDVLLVPNHSSVLPKDVSLQTKLTKKISLNKGPGSLLRLASS